jgi:hypothetical protein
VANCGWKCSPEWTILRISGRSIAMSNFKRYLCHTFFLDKEGRPKSINVDVYDINQNRKKVKKVKNFRILELRQSKLCKSFDRLISVTLMRTKYLDEESLFLLMQENKDQECVNFQKVRRFDCQIIEWFEDKMLLLNFWQELKSEKSRVLSLSFVDTLLIAIAVSVSIVVMALVAALIGYIYRHQ